ncbi:MAG: patatin-like phospholipase family protein [Acidobacteriota bacterium]
MQPTFFALQTTGQTILQTVLDILPYLYLMRMPIVTALLLVAIPYLAYKTNASALLKGLFDVRGFGLSVVALLSFLTAWTILFTSKLVLFQGPKRFSTLTPLPLNPDFPWYDYLVGLLAVPMIIGAFMNFKSSFSKILQGIGLAILGGALSIVALQIAIHPKTAQLFEDYFSLKTIFDFLGKGYESGHHSVAAALFAISMLVYASIGIVKYFRLNSRRFSELVPTLSYVILLIMILCWLISGMTFFLDFYRVPVFMVIAILLLITAQFKQTDYYYNIFPAKTLQQETPKSAPDEIMRKEAPEYAIVVAANGGGIQASAWAAQVLTGLQETFGNQFGSHIKVISSVSGGSVGSMYFVNGYTADGPPNGETLNQIVESAMRSSLNDVSWGLVYPDFWRVILPFFGDSAISRGWALEQAWKKNCDTAKCDLSKCLSEWREGVNAGWRPANIFNATVADTGQRFLMATTKVPSKTYRPQHDAFLSQGSLSFEKAYPDKDLAVVTAARLSATFPYVTPAARADVEGVTFHVVDGGYYDNYGIASLVEWLDYALQKTSNQIKRIMVLQIRGAAPSTLQAENNRGWFYQAFAPIATLLHVRDTGQISHNDIELDLLQKFWQGKNEAERVIIDTAIFEYQSPDKNESPPLSWHLTEQDKENIRQAWRDVLAGKDDYKGLEKMRDFLNQK